MIFFSKDVEDSFNTLLYYPYTIGAHLDKTSIDVRNIMNEFSSLPIGRHGATLTRTIPNIGTITYLFTSSSYFIQSITWSPTLTRFYYVKSHFITFTKDRNIPSDHPNKYKMRTEDSFKCDNGFKVISRKYRGMELFNFMDLDGHIVSDIDFTQVKPFSEYKDMTARGYTPDRRCYMVYDDGSRTEVNETRNRTKSNITHLTETHLKQIIFESVWEAFNKAKYMP